MPNWSEVLKEIQAVQVDGSLDVVRRRYLKKLHEKTGRNIIAYYSGWLQRRSENSAAVQYLATITDDDKNGFMNAIHGMNRSIGLDLILHTPGGDLAATESIVDYLHRMFGHDIRAFIPQLAMSGGTMIACACKEIFMGKQSNLGPIDPQFGGIPAHGVIAEFNEAIKAIKNDPASIPIWRAVVEKYHPTFIGECQNAIDLASEIVTEWLVSGMFFGDDNANNKAACAVSKLNNHADTKTHSRHLHINEIQEFGLKVVPLEDDSELQDIVLTIHHSYMHTFACSNGIKIVENHNGNAIVQNIKR